MNSTDRGARLDQPVVEVRRVTVFSRLRNSRRRVLAWFEVNAARQSNWKYGKCPPPASADFVDGIPAPLGIGTVELENGEQVHVISFVSITPPAAHARLPNLVAGVRMLRNASARLQRTRYPDTRNKRETHKKPASHNNLDTGENFMASVAAEPYEFEFEPSSCALMIIDMQRDFVDPGGFGEALGNDVSLLRKGDCTDQKSARRSAQKEHARHPHT